MTKKDIIYFSEIEKSFANIKVSYHKQNITVSVEFIEEGEKGAIFTLEKIGNNNFHLKEQLYKNKQ